MRMFLRMNCENFVLAAEFPCEWKFATKFASECECDGLVHSEEGAPESAHKGWFSLFSALQRLPTKAPTKRPTKVSIEVPTKSVHSTGRGSPVLFSSVLFLDQKRWQHQTPPCHDVLPPPWQLYYMTLSAPSQRMAKGGGIEGGIWKQPDFWIKGFSGIFQAVFRHFSSIFRGSGAMKNAWKFLDSKIRVFWGISQFFFRLKRAFSYPPFCAPTLWHPPTLRPFTRIICRVRIILTFWSSRVHALSWTLLWQQVTESRAIIP